MHLSRHAQLRADQRGIFLANLEAPFNLADLAKVAARGLTVLRVSRRSLAYAAEQSIDTATVARLRKLVR